MGSTKSFLEENYSAPNTKLINNVYKSLTYIFTFVCCWATHYCHANKINWANISSKHQHQHNSYRMVSYHLKRYKVKQGNKYSTLYWTLAGKSALKSSIFQTGRNNYIPRKAYSQNWECTQCVSNVCFNGFIVQVEDNINHLQNNCINCAKTVAPQTKIFLEKIDIIISFTPSLTPRYIYTLT